MNTLKSILLVEDNAYDAEMTLVALGAHNLANDVVHAVDGEEGLDYLYARGKFAGRGQGNPVLILLDLKMPKLDGLEVLRTIKSDPALRAIPVVMLTSSREEQDLVRSYEIGVNAYVVKPVEFNRFVEAVSQLSVFWAIHNEPPPGSARRAP